jgi:hypothetical protein
LAATIDENLAELLDAALLRNRLSVAAEIQQIGRRRARHHKAGIVILRLDVIPPLRRDQIAQLLKKAICSGNGWANAPDAADGCAMVRSQLPQGWI